MAFNNARKGFLRECHMVYKQTSGFLSSCLPGWNVDNSGWIRKLKRDIEINLSQRIPYRRGG